jgi:hypothetical protein
MKNFEKYLYEIAGTICKFSTIAYRNPDEANCTCLTVDPTKHNIHTVMKWLNEEYKEPIKLTHDEYVILKNVDECYKWIARNPYHCSLRFFIKKPFKKSTDWQDGFNRGGNGIEVFNNLFQFVKWEDSEPYEIAKLIADYEKENEE